MEPTTMALIYLGTQALKAGGNIYAGTQEFNRDDRQRLKDLERQEALGRLGMNPQEMARAQREIVQPLQTLQREAAQERRSQIQAQDLGQGTAFRQMQQQEELRQQGRLMAQQMLQQQQESAISRDKQEMAELEAARTRRRQMIAQSAGTAAADVGKFAVEQANIEEDRKLQAAFYDAQLSKVKEGKDDINDIAGVDEDLIPRLIPQ